MAVRDQEKLDQKLDRFSEMLPAGIQRMLRWLRAPSSRIYRIPIGILLIFGGLLSFLPVLGVWMTPLGVILLAQDVPFLQRPTRWAITKLERRWTEWKRRRSSSTTS